MLQINNNLLYIEKENNIKLDTHMWKNYLTRRVSNYVFFFKQPFVLKYVYETLPLLFIKTINPFSNFKKSEITEKVNYFREQLFLKNNKHMVVFYDNRKNEYYLNIIKDKLYFISTKEINIDLNYNVSKKIYLNFFIIYFKIF